MEFPIALESYANFEESNEPPFLIERRVVFNEIEANQFIKEHSRNKIVTKPLTADELGDERIN